VGGVDWPLDWPSISLHGWGGHTCVPPTVERDRRACPGLIPGSRNWRFPISKSRDWKMVPGLETLVRIHTSCLFAFLHVDVLRIIYSLRPIHSGGERSIRSMRGNIRHKAQYGLFDCVPGQFFPY